MDSDVASKNLFKTLLKPEFPKPKNLKPESFNNRFKRKHFNPLKTGSHPGYSIEIRITNYYTTSLTKSDHLR